MKEDSDALTSKGSSTQVKVVSASGDGEKSSTTPGDDAAAILIKTYKRRWLMMLLYMFFAGLVAGQWVQYSIISDIVSAYYDVSLLAVDWTSMIFMLFYGIFIFPVTFISERIGQRWMLILASALCCAGSWIKVLSVEPDWEGFLMTMFGQSVVALSLVIMLTLPGRVAAKWFGSNELSTATSLGVFGPQLGISIAFLLPPVIVKFHKDENEAPIKDSIGADLSYMFWCVAIATSVNLVLMVMFFQEEPKLPPNETRALQKSNLNEKSEGFVKPMKRLFSNKSFLILCNSYGLNVGILNAIGTLLNQLFQIHFHGRNEDSGRIGLLIILTGMFGSIAFGVILDKTHKFKETTVIVYFLTFCGQILFAVAMFVEVLWMVYATAIFLGFFMSGYLALGYEMAAEYTYPESESHSAGILNITNNVYGIVIVLILEQVIERYGDVPVHVIFCLILLIGLIMTIFTKDEQRRQDARKAAVRYRDVPQREDDKVDFAGAAGVNSSV